MLALSLYNFTYYFIISLTVAFLPLYFQNKGMNPAEIGFLLAMGPLITIFAQPFWGLISDKYQTVKRIVLLLLIFTLITGSSVFLFDSFPMLIIAMILFNFFFMPVQPLVDSLATVYCMEQNRNYGLIRVWGSIGFSIASISIGLITNAIGIKNLGGLFVAFVLLTIIVASQLTDSNVKKEPITKQKISKTLRSKEYLLFLLAVFFIFTPHKMNDSIFGLYMKSLHASETEIGTAWTVAALCEAPMIAFTAVLMKKFHYLQLVSFAGFIYALRWLLYGLISDPEIIIGLQALHSLSFAIFLIASLQYVSLLVPIELLATCQTIYFAVQGGLGGIVGSTLGGYLMEHISAPFAYQAGSVMALLGSCICMYIFHGIRKKNYAT